MIRGSNLDKGKRFSTSLKRPGQLCGPHSLLFSGYSEPVPGFSDQSESLTTNLHLEQDEVWV